MINPQAFPNKHANADTKAFCGMTLRDYFAAAALQGVMAAGPTESGWLLESTKDHIASYCYIQADAMVKAREQ